MATPSTSPGVSDVFPFSRILVRVSKPANAPTTEDTMNNRHLLSIATIALLAACDAPDAVGPAATARTPRTAATPGSMWAVADTGETGPGSTYAVFVPTNWNGSAVFYAHGFKDVGDPVSLPTKDNVETFRDQLGAAGFAVAYSGYSENGFAVKDGIQRTHQLRGLLASKAGVPQRSYLAGTSLGGVVALALAEQYPDQYDGALSMCGFVGGSKKQIDYVGNTRALFDWFYPGVLPGNTISMPAGTTLNEVIGKAYAAILARPDKAFLITQISQTPIPFTNSTEMVVSLLNVLGFHARGINDLIDRTHGHNLFDNSDVIYTGSPAVPASILAAMNHPEIGVQRFESTPDADNYLRKYYEPTGNLRIPVLSMHTTHDPSVPFDHQRVFREKVATAGTSAMLRTRPITRYGHCTFTTAEMVGAMQDVANWAETGTAPLN